MRLAWVRGTKTPVGPIRLDLSYNLNPPIYPVFYDYTANSPYVGQASHFQFFFSIGQAVLMTMRLGQLGMVVVLGLSASVAPAQGGTTAQKENVPAESDHGTGGSRDRRCRR